MNSALLPLALFLLYLVPSFSFDFVFQFWQGLVPYYFELTFVAIVIALYRKDFVVTLFEKAKMTRSVLVYMAGGAIALSFARVFSTEIPFDLSANGTILFMVVLGPLLEELIFRFSLWTLILKVTKCEKSAFYITTFLFSLAHFKAVFIINDAFVTFIVFQSLYTMILARQLGERYLLRKSVSEVVILHGAFNLGFWLASLVMY